MGALPDWDKGIILLRMLDHDDLYTGVTNQEIGNRFGGLSYSAAAKVCRRLDEAVGKNRGLSRKIQRIERTLL
jgi:hypothetical protein